MSMWALWAATEVEPHALTVLVHRVSRPPAERDAKLAQAAVEALRAPFAVLDKALAATGYLVGGRYRGRHQHRRGRAFFDGRRRAVRGGAQREDLAGGLPCAAGVPRDDGGTREGAGVNRHAARRRAGLIWSRTRATVVFTHPLYRETRRTTYGGRFASADGQAASFGISNVMACRARARPFSASSWLMLSPSTWTKLTSVRPTKARIARRYGSWKSSARAGLSPL